MTKSNPHKGKMKKKMEEGKVPGKHGSFIWHELSIKGLHQKEIDQNM